MTEDEQLQLDPNPTPKGESEDFENPDDKRWREQNAHNLAILQANQGPLGRLIGSSDSTLTIAFTLLTLGALGILGTCIGMIWYPEQFGGIVEKLITFELTVAGYVMGKKT